MQAGLAATLVRRLISKSITCRNTAVVSQLHTHTSSGRLQKSIFRLEFCFGGRSKSGYTSDWPENVLASKATHQVNVLITLAPRTKHLPTPPAPGMCHWWCQQYARPFAGVNKVRYKVRAAILAKVLLNLIKLENPDPLFLLIKLVYLRSL
jgi:hypothetical protein